MNWWKRKQITHVLLLLLCIGLFSCTADPPVGGAEITAPEEYLNVNHYVETALHSDFPDFLPDREALDPSADILRYHYEYCCGVLGDPQFAISMQVEFRDDAAYQAESGRIMRHVCSSIRCRKRSPTLRRSYMMGRSRFLLFRISCMVLA